MPDNLPLSFATERTRSVASFAFASVTEGMIKSSFCTKDLPLWLLRTTV